MAQGWLLGGVIGSGEGGDAGTGKDKRKGSFCFSATAAAAPSTVNGAIHVSRLKTLRAYQRLHWSTLGTLEAGKHHKSELRTPVDQLMALSIN